MELISGIWTINSIILAEPSDVQQLPPSLVVSYPGWVEAIPLPDLKVVTITNELIKVLFILGIPEILHSDQGCNFECTFGSNPE